VNILGAATIVAARRVLGGDEFPFAFGGDGATLIVPDEMHLKVMERLAGLKGLARTRFGMELRLGSIRVSEVAASGGSVEVAKFAISEHCQIAELRGDGLRLAENRIKQVNSPLQFDRPGEPPDLTGLSCRWQPFRNRNGIMLTLIIETREDCGQDPSLIFSRVIEKIDTLLPGGLEGANPSRSSLSGYRKFSQLLREELRYQNGSFSMGGFLRILEVLLAGFLFNNGIPIPLLKRYVRDTPAHSDYRKFDSSFRAVLDCTLDQRNQIESLLESERRAGTIHYGIHVSDEALMTCMVEGLNPGQHLHFIDGSDGGYALAADFLKRQKQTPH
jgi:hypothetical protein